LGRVGLQLGDLRWGIRGVDGGGYDMRSSDVNFVNFRVRGAR